MAALPNILQFRERRFLWEQPCLKDFGIDVLCKSITHILLYVQRQHYAGFENSELYIGNLLGCRTVWNCKHLDSSEVYHLLTAVFFCECTIVHE